MSIEAIAKASKITDLPSTTKFVLIALSNYANDDGEAWPKQSTLAEWCNMKRETVQRHLSKLEEEGYLSSETRRYADGRNASKVYKLEFLQGDFKSHSEARVTESHPYKVTDSHTDRVTESHNKNHQHRTINLEPSLKDTKTLFEKPEIQKIEKPTEVKTLTLSKVTTEELLEPKKSTTLQKENSSASALEWFQITYNHERPVMWSDATVLNKKRKDKIATFIKEHGEEKAREIFILALAYVQNDSWWSTKNISFDTLWTNNHLVSWYERRKAQLVTGGLSEADANLTLNALRWFEGAKSADEKRRAQA